MLRISTFLAIVLSVTMIASAAVQAAAYRAQVRGRGCAARARRRRRRRRRTAAGGAGWGRGARDAAWDDARGSGDSGRIALLLTGDQPRLAPGGQARRVIGPDA